MDYFLGMVAYFALGAVVAVLFGRAARLGIEVLERMDTDRL